MVDDIQELYREMVMEHSRKPKNFRRLQAATCSADGFNPFCGDQLTLDATLDGDNIADIGFVGVRLRHLEGVGFPDDRGREGQEQGPKPTSCSRHFTT